MSFITTFSATFFAFTALTLVSAAAGYLAVRIAAKRRKSDEFQSWLQARVIPVNCGWMAMLVLAGLFDVRGVTTFLFWAVVAGVVLAFALRALHAWQAKRRAKDSTRLALDMLGLGS